MGFRRFVLSVLAAVCAPGLAVAQSAADWPAKPIKFVVNYGAGGSSDNSIRPFAPHLSMALGQQVVIENKGGASGAIGAEAVVRSAPDGYTFLVTPVAAITILPQVRKVPYDPFKDLVPVARHADSLAPLTVNPAVPAKNLRELQAYAKANPGKLSFGGVGLGTSTQLIALMLNKALGIDILYVPYRGSGEALPDVLANVVQVYIDPNGLPQVAAGKLRVLAFVDRVRHPDYPDVPTSIESFPELEFGSWFGVFAPAGTPAAIADKMNEAISRIARTKEMREQLLKYSNRARAGTRAEFAAEIKADWERHGALIKEYKITLD